jgi:hypothetical protein
MFAHCSTSVRAVVFGSLGPPAKAVPAEARTLKHIATDNTLLRFITISVVHVQTKTPPTTFVGL